MTISRGGGSRPQHWGGGRQPVCRWMADVLEETKNDNQPRRGEGGVNTFEMRWPNNNQLWRGERGESAALSELSETPE